MIKFVTDMKKKVIPDPILMLVTILLIVCFQGYWLNDNYKRERRALEIRAGVAFQETVYRLQSVKLKLPFLPVNDSGHKQTTRIFLDEDVTEASAGIRSLPRRQVVTMVNTIRDKINGAKNSDSTVRWSEMHSVMDSNVFTKDSVRYQFERSTDSSNHLFNVLYRVDSLQDSIRVAEIVPLYKAALKRENIYVPFSINRLAGTRPPDETGMGTVTVGFAHPVTYQLSLEKTGNYLLQKILLPIGFSFFLVAVTILSFILLYRNLLRQKRLADIKNDFISNITHELKTPIATVGVAIEALNSFNAIQDPGKTKEYLEISAAELQRLSLLVDKVLKFSMFERKEMSLSKETFDLKQSVMEVLDSMKLQFKKANADIHFASEGDNFLIKADKLHIASVLYNLLDNALKYSKRDLVISIRLIRIRDIFELSVSDNGIGIEKEYKSKIFEKFFRVPTDNIHMVKGYGLGLSYVSEIVRRHMGYISVESEPGKGSDFIVKIPVEEANLIRFDDKRSMRKIAIRLPSKKKYEQ